MPPTMSCPGCKTRLRLRDDLAGKKIKCPRCSTVIAVPAEGAIMLEEAPAPSVSAARPSVSSAYKPCPRCGEEGAERVLWTPWGSFYGPALLTHVRCPVCRYAYNGKSGRSNLLFAIIFVTVPLLFILAILGALGWFIHHQGYF